MKVKCRNYHLLNHQEILTALKLSTNSVFTSECPTKNQASISF
jgi:hypothetical protein